MPGYENPPPNPRSLPQIPSQFLLLLPLSKILAFCALAPSGGLAYPRRLFAQIPHTNVFSWNSMMRGSSQLPNPFKEPIFLYKQMLQEGFAFPNSFTLAFVLKARSLILAFFKGRQIHCHAFKHRLCLSPFVETGLLNFYARCEELVAARLVFDEIPDKNLIAWSAMISGYARVGLVNAALELFGEMQGAGINPDEVRMVSVIQACAKAGALDLGKWVYAFIDGNGITADLELKTALIDMCARCGEIDRARKMFDGMEVRDTKAWSSMIVGLAIRGLVKDALELFSRMFRVQGTGIRSMHNL